MAIETLDLKKVSTDSATTFNAVDVIPGYVVEGENYIDVDFARQRIIYARYKSWLINFAYLDTAAQDFLNDFAEQESPQFIYAATTYNVEVSRMNARAVGGSMTIINRAKEV